MKNVRSKATKGLLLDDTIAAAPTERERIATSIRARSPVSDRLFDRLLPADARAVSSRYWTPLRAAVRAAEWLDEVGARTVVDIGSGAGKFCVAAALASRASFLGVEHRRRFVMIARELAMELGVSERVSFLHRQFGADLTANADAYYLYNPFGENLFQQCHQLDFSVELSERRYSQDVGFVERLLQDAAVGTYLVTFSGFGGLVPRTYEEVRVDWTLPSILRMWKKTSPGSGSP